MSHLILRVERLIRRQLSGLRECWFRALGANRDVDTRQGSPLRVPRLEIEEATLKRDCDSVGTIARLQLRHDALQVALHRVLGERHVFRYEPPCPRIVAHKDAFRVCGHGLDLQGLECLH